MMLRRSFLMLAFAVASTRAISEDAASFQSFLDGLWRDAAARAIKRTTFEAAFAGVTPDSAVLAAMRQQPEYGKPFGSYLASLVSPARIEGGLRKSAQWATTLRAVEEKFGVDKSILVSIWGIERSLRRLSSSPAIATLWSRQGSTRCGSPPRCQALEWKCFPVSAICCTTPPPTGSSPRSRS
jgi:hypothetical protein